MKLKNCFPRVFITLKLWRVDGTVETYHTHRTKRFYAIVKAEKFQKAYLRVWYGKFKSNNGRNIDFYNDGDYSTKTELINVFKDFLESNTENSDSSPAKTNLSE